MSSERRQVHFENAKVFIYGVLSLSRKEIAGLRQLRQGRSAVLGHGTGGKHTARRTGMGLYSAVTGHDVFGAEYKAFARKSASATACSITRHRCQTTVMGVAGPRHSKAICAFATTSLFLVDGAHLLGHFPFVHWLISGSCLTHCWPAVR